MARLALVCSLALAVTLVTVQAQNYPRLTSANLTALGSFNVPGNIRVGSANSGFEYGGAAIAFNPANSSLYMVGHDWDQFIGEIKIPALGGTATLLQGPTESLAGKGDSVGPGTWKIGGNLIYNNKLYVTSFLFYDASNVQTLSHFSRPLTLSSGTVTGPSRVGSMSGGFYSGYMGLIPTEWQAALGGPALTGNCCLSIISRTSYGPAAFAFNPESLGTSYPLVYYDQQHQTLGAYGASGSHPVFNGTTRVRGVVFPRGTATVLFIGSTGIGNYCYGEAAACGGDPDNPYKGDHAYPYRAYVWAYDANDFAAVKAGTKQPWQVTPYSTWELPLGNVSSDAIIGAAYDPATARLYISEKFGDGEKPKIHVFSISNSTTGGTSPPQAPSNLRVVS
jgi:hypothetical protein